MVTTRSRFGGMRLPTPVVLVTLVVLVAMYIVVGILLNVANDTGQTLFHALTLDAKSLLSGQVWRLVTYALLHDPSNPMHLLLNGLMLYFFGRDVEQRLGAMKFGGFLLGAVLAGGLCVVAVNLAGLPSVAVGFSGAVEACTVFWALNNRNAQVLFMFAIPIRGIHMLWLAVAQWIFDAVSTSHISAAAHFGGIVFGLAVYFIMERGLLKNVLPKRGPKLTVVPKNNDRWVN